MSEVSSATDTTNSIMQALDVGTGINIKDLAQSLADAENKPNMDRISDKITQRETAISGYGVLSNSVKSVKTALEALNDLGELSTKAATLSSTTSIDVSNVNSTAIAGSYSMTVSQLASSQQLISNASASSSTALNSGSSFDISVAVGATSPVNSTIAVTSDTPAGVVSAINASSTGLKAFLVQENSASTSVKIMVQGPSGAEGQFTISSTPNLGFSTSGNALPTAQNAIMTLNGLTGIQRSSNEFSDLIPGTTVKLKATTGSAVSLSISEDRSIAKTSIQALVTAYNDFETTVDELLNEESTNFSYSGSLSNDSSTTRLVKQKVADAIKATSSTQSGTMKALINIGVSSDRYGQLTIDNTKLDAALSSNFSDVANMLSANTDNQTLFDTANKGLAADAIIILDDLTSTNGAIKTSTASTTKAIDRYQEQLEKLETRLQKAYDSYIEQFSAMESLVESFSSTGEYLTGQFKAMENAYSNN